MKIIEKDYIGDAWQDAFDFIMKNGYKIMDGNQELIEYLHLILIINFPNEHDSIAESQDEKMKIWMDDNFTQIKRVPELHNAWSYGWRLYDYQGTDQIDWIINKLANKPESKSATITMLQKAGSEPYIPCVSLFDFKIRDDQLILTATCRSLDLGKKAIYNMTNLARLCNDVSKKLDIKNTCLVIYIISAHIYQEEWN